MAHLIRTSIRVSGVSHWRELPEQGCSELTVIWQDLRGLAAHIDRFVRLLCRAQWKRERFAISFRVTAFDLDPKTGFRFPPVQAPFTDELAELHAHVATMVDG